MSKDDVIEVEGKVVEKQFYEFFLYKCYDIIKLIIVGLEMSLCPCWMREAQGLSAGSVI